PTPASQPTALGPGSPVHDRRPQRVYSKAGPPPAASGPGTGATMSADASATTAITAKTVPAPPAASRTPARAGATSMDRLSIQPEATFAAVSSSGVRASAGVTTACAGRVMVTAVAATAARA